MIARRVALIVLAGFTLGQPLAALARAHPCPPFARQVDESCVSRAELREPHSGDPVMPWR